MEFKVVKFIEAESRMVVAKGQEREGKMRCWNRYKVAILQDEKSEISCATVWMYLIPLKCVIKKWLRWLKNPKHVSN